MIEVEIRGKLNQQEYDDLRKFLHANGKFLKKEVREMFLLRDYPGYDANPITRDVDIRLRNTNGESEIMVKRKVSDGNVSRKEYSLKLKDGDLAMAKEIAKAFGCRTAIKMNRSKELFEYKGVEWSIVEAPKQHYYFEAEKEAPDTSHIEQTQDEVKRIAAEMNLKVLSLAETKEFIELLDREVNTEVEL